MIAVLIDEFTPCLKNTVTGEIVETEVVSQDIGVNVSAIVSYARDHRIPLSKVPSEVIEKNTYAHLK